MVERWIALRYLKPRRDSLFVSLIGLISILGVTIGVTSIILVLSILNGFEREVKTRFVGFDAHIKVRKPHHEGFGDWESIVARVRDHPRVTAVSPYILQKAMITSAAGSHVGFVKGTLPEAIVQVTDLKDNLYRGDLDLAPREDAPGGMVIGYSMDLTLESNLHDTITVISPVGVTSPFSVPDARRFVLTGVFKTEMFEYDNGYAFIGLAEAQKLFEMADQIQGIDVRLDDMTSAFEVQHALSGELGPDFVVETWYDQHADLYQAMAIEKWGSLVLLSLIIMVASFNIVSTLIMVVMQKTQDIGILQSMGAGARMISSIFVQQGLMVGGLGIVLGSIIGYGLCFLQMQFHFIKLPGDVFFLDALPVEVKLVDFLAIIFVALFICLFSTLYPARRASRLAPVEALKS